jgi:hypothetical protein
MHFSTKSYLKSNRNHTAKQTLSLERTSRPKSSAFQELYLYHEPIGTSYTINSLSTNRQQSSYQKTFHMEIFVQRSHSMLCNQYNNGD